MKAKHRALAFLLSMLMVLTFMPALAFADDAPASGNARPVAEGQVRAGGAGTESAPAPTATRYPTKIEYVGIPLEGFVGSEDIFFRQEGVAFKITYSDGKVWTFKYVGFVEEYDEDFDDFYLNGDPDRMLLPGDYWSYIATDEPLKAGDNKVVLCYEYANHTVKTKINVKGIVDEDVKSFSYNRAGGTLTLDYAEMRDEGVWEVLYNRPANFLGDKATITEPEEDYEGNVSDVTRTYTYTEDPDDEGYYCFFKEESGDYYYADICYAGDVDPYSWRPGQSYTLTPYYRGVPASETITVNVTGPVVPSEVIFNPAPGFVPSANIGAKWVGIDPFYGEGNSFTVRYTDGSEKVYKYAKTKDGWYDFFLNGKTSTEPLWLYSEELKSGLAKGENTLTFIYWEYIDELGEEYEIEFPLTVVADKYDAEVITKTYTYTGKYITPKISVKNSAGKTLVKGTDYKVSVKKGKNIGIYNIKVTLLSALEDRDLYREKVLYSSYVILPKTPVIKSVKPGKGSLTVTWKKFSSTQLKAIDGFYIEIATDKYFIKNYKRYTVSKKLLSKTIKKLKKGKKYYVRVSAYKAVKYGGHKYVLWSNQGKLKAATTKK